MMLVTPAATTARYAHVADDPVRDARPNGLAIALLPRCKGRTLDRRPLCGAPIIDREPAIRRLHEVLVRRLWEVGFTEIFIGAAACTLAPPNGPTRGVVALSMDGSGIDPTLRRIPRASLLGVPLGASEMAPAGRRLEGTDPIIDAISLSICVYYGHLAFS
jgi:hypothetical protein